LSKENMRQGDLLKEVVTENDKLKQENSYLIQRTDTDINKLQNYLEEQEQNSCQ
jgi:hypothetical protein